MSFKQQIDDNKPLLLAILTLLVLSNIPYGNYFLYPFELFSTWIHETCHGLAALAVGGSFNSLHIYPDTSGLARNAIPVSKINAAIVSSAGYVGTTIFGALLLLLQRPTRFSKAVAGAVMLALMLLTFSTVRPWTGIIFYIALISFIGVLAFFTPVNDVGRTGTFAFGVLMLFTLLYARDLFTIFLLAMMGLGLVAIGWRLPPSVGKFSFSFLAATCGLNALTSIKELFSSNLMINGQKAAQSSDAHAVAKALFGPHTLWASMWLLFSIVVLGWALFRALSAPTLLLPEVEAPESSMLPPKAPAHKP